MTSHSRTFEEFIQRRRYPDLGLDLVANRIQHFERSMAKYPTDSHELDVCIDKLTKWKKLKTRRKGINEH